MHAKELEEMSDERDELVMDLTASQSELDDAVHLSLCCVLLCTSHCAASHCTPLTVLRLTVPLLLCLPLCLYLTVSLPLPHCLSASTSLLLSLYLTLSNSLSLFLYLIIAVALPRSL